MRYIVILLAFFTTNAFAGGGGQWVEDWWDNVYEQRIKQEQYKEIEEKNDNKCDTKIQYYETKVSQDPSSEYFRWKLDVWRGKCHDN